MVSSFDDVDIYRKGSNQLCVVFKAVLYDDDGVLATICRIKVYK